MKPIQVIQRFLVPAPLITIYCRFVHGCNVSPRSEVELSSFLSIGKSTVISSFTKVKSSNGPLKIGANVSIATGCFISSQAMGLEIGDYSMIGPNTCIMAGSHKYDRIDIPMQQQGIISKKGVKIGNNVWIGAGCCILDGAEIGDGVIVYPNSIVSTSIPENTVVMGNPAKVIFKRR